MNATKRMTIKYWNSLSNETKVRAYKQVFPHLAQTADWAALEDPKTDSMVKMVISKTRIPESTSHYKVVYNGIYFC